MSTPAQQNRRLKLALLTVILVVVIGVAAVFVGYRQMMDAARPPVAGTDPEATMSIANIHQVAKRNGITEWSLDAEAAVLRGGKEAVVEQPSVVFFLENDRKVYLTADRGVINTITHNIRLSGNVIMKNDAYQMKTETMNYRHDSRVFLSDAPVRITGKAIDLSADGASYDLNTRKAVFQGRVKGKLGGDFTL